jgi:hypothetical protein
MCLACGRSHILAKDSPSERQVRQRFIEALISVLSDWHDDILTALETRDFEPVTTATARRALERLFEPHAEPFRTTFADLYKDSARAGRATTAQRYDLDLSDELADRLVRELQNLADETADAVSERMTDDIAEALQEAYADGLAIPELERILAEEVFPEMRSWESERIARTEGTTGAARGALSGIRDAGAPRKQWLAEDDTRTRTAHREADGQVVPVGSTFTVNGEAAQFPGDPSLSPANRINCRCNLAPAWDL